VRRLLGACSRALSELYARLPLPGVRRPTFIVGCGRSGTTILGEALGRHPRVTFLNEPGHLWLRAYPETDVWTPRSAERGGRLVLTAADDDPVRSRRLARLFRWETLRRCRPVLVEKLPANSFRLGLIGAAFPDARYLHILRDGVEVARSIERFTRTRWFGSDGRKWDLLRQLAASRPETAALPEGCRGDFERGLLEWRLSTGEIRAFLDANPGSARLEIRYDDLVDAPVRTVSRCLEFLGLEGSSRVDSFTETAIRRRTPSLRSEPPSPREAEIAGPLLLGLRRGAERSGDAES
jgi:hypothetical protein